MHGLSRARGGEYHLFAEESCNVFVVVDITYVEKGATSFVILLQTEG